MSELLRQLEILSYLAQRKGASVAAIAEHLKALGYAGSEPTVKRDVAELRHLGADIISDRIFGYRLMNWPHIRERVRRWRELERDRAAYLDRGLSG